LPSPRQSFEKLALAITVAGALVFGSAVHAKRPAEGAAQATVALGALPAEAQRAQRQILSGGPFQYSKDGTVFGNREGLLPSRSKGYYREYTVPTPGARDRGARRIVCGGERPTVPDACFYTGDHYASFARIAQ
jgi:ribonuclease T1